MTHYLLHQRGAVAPTFVWLRIGFLLLLSLFIKVFAVAQGCDGTPVTFTTSTSTHSIQFVEVKYDFPVAGQSTWFYSITSGSSPAISHLTFDIKLSDDATGCPQFPNGVNSVGTWTKTGNNYNLSPNQGSPSIGKLNESGVVNNNNNKALKFEQGFSDNGVRNYYFTVTGNYLPVGIDTYVKAGNSTDKESVCGPGCNLKTVCDIPTVFEMKGTGTIASDCAPPTNFNYETIADGNWLDASTWKDDLVPNQDLKSAEKIKITHNVTVQNGDILLNSDVVIYVLGKKFTIRNGNLGLKSSGAKFIMQNGILQTSGNVQLDEVNTFVCIKDSEVEIGDEDASTGFTQGQFNKDAPSTKSTSADFQNVKGYTYMENVCINVTHDFQTKADAETILVDVCLEVGDRGQMNATQTAYNTKDGDDSGNYENDNINKIYNTQIAIANGNFKNNKGTMTACDVDVRVNGDGTGSFQVNDGTLQGTGLCIGANDLIQNQGTWTADVSSYWARNSGLPGNISGNTPASESTAAQIDAMCFENCCQSEDINLNLVAECKVGNLLYWRVVGDDDVDNVSFTWDGPGSNDGNGIVDAGENYYFTTIDAGGANTTTITWYNPATNSNNSDVSAHNNWPCVYHITPEKSWTTTPPSGLNGTTILYAESSIATATCGYDANGVWKCTYTRKPGNPITSPTTPVDLEVPFGESYAVYEVPVNGWIPSAGVGNSFCRVDGFDASALPNSLTYDLCDNPYSTQKQGQTLAKFGTHTVVNEEGSLTGDCESGQFWLKNYGLIALGNLQAVNHIELNAFIAGDLDISGALDIGSLLTNSNFGNDKSRNAIEVVGTVVSGSIIKLLNFSGAFSPLNTIVAPMSGIQWMVNGRTVEVHNIGASLKTDYSLAAKAAQIEADLKAASNKLSQATANNTVGGTTNNRVFDAVNVDGNGVAVFNLPDASVFSASSIAFANSGGASTIIINVPGTTINSTANISSSIYQDIIIWNFYEATSLTMNGSVTGTILAPMADITIGTNVDGVIVGQDISIGSQSHDPFFAGDFSSLCSGCQIDAQFSQTCKVNDEVIITVLATGAPSGKYLVKDGNTTVAGPVDNGTTVQFTGNEGTQYTVVDNVDASCSTTFTTSMQITGCNDEETCPTATFFDMTALGFTGSDLIGDNGNFNAIIGGNFTISGVTAADSEGRLAIGGNLSNNTGNLYTVGEISGSGASRAPIGIDNLVVVGDINGPVGVRGNVVYGGAGSGISFIAGTDGTGIQRQVNDVVNNVLDIPGAISYFQSESMALATCSGGTEGTVTSEFGTVTLNGLNASGVVYFEIPSANASTSYNFVNVGNASAILVNVGGTSATFSGGSIFLEGLANPVPLYPIDNTPAEELEFTEKTLWNFYEATTFSMSNFAMVGSVLAPKTNTVMLTGGGINGQVVFGGDVTVSGGFEFHNFCYNGDLSTCGVAEETGAIGNYVWLDENSDGLQDAGEPGIPNVRVDLKDANGNIIATTYTDSDGKYLFPNVAPGTYFVDVVEATLPTGLSQTTGYTNTGDNVPSDDNQEGDLGNKDQSQSNGYQVVLSSGEENLTADFGYNYNPTNDVNNGMNTASIGDRVWIDSDGDGVQDANEIGVSGIEVTLKDAGPDGIAGNADDVTVTTKTTDANGYYLFDGLAPGAYTVTVTSSTGASHAILTGGQYTQTGDPDHFAEPVANAPAGTAGDNKTTKPVVLGPGDVFLNADFGYQPDGAQLGSIGNTVWLDADADGRGPSGTITGINGDAINGAAGTSDDNETPIAGVTVALIKDLDGDGTWDANEPIIATDVTDALGQYLFEDLPTGDDYIVWVNDTDNVLDGLKPTYDSDAGSISNASGALTGVATSSRLGISSVMNLGTTPVTNQDFGYTPNTQDAGEGLIGDYVWFDTNRDGVQDADESGIEGVQVQLIDLGADEMIGGGDDEIVATTTTDENGYYYFGGLSVDDGDGDATYQVVIASSNFNAGQPLEGLENTFDPNGGNDNIGGAVSLTSANPVNLMQDFGYAGDDAGTLGSIGNQIWEDEDADGVKDAGETTGIAGVTLDLYRDLNGDGLLNPGEPKIGTTTTDANGNYLFSQLPAGNYIVDVTDDGGLLNGYWLSLSSNQNATTNSGNDPQDNSKTDAFAVTIGNGSPINNLNVDFGYYKDGASLGNYVWNDHNEDGLQNDGESGINNIVVTLTIDYQNGTTTILKTLTKNDANGNPGFYEFPNLLLDEDYNTGTSGTPSVDDLPKFTISINSNQSALTGFVATTKDVNSNGNDKEDSDDKDGVVAIPTQGNNNTTAQDPETNEDVIASYDFGFICNADDVTVTVSLSPNVVGSENQMVQATFTVVNSGTSNLSNVTFEGIKRLLTNGTESNITIAAPVESGTANMILSAGETWTYTANFTLGSYNAGDIYAILGQLEADSDACGEVLAAGGDFLFTVGVNMDVEIDDCFTPGQDLEVTLITRLLIDEDEAKNPTPVEINGQQVQIPARQFEARDLWITVTGVNGGNAFNPFSPPGGVNIQRYTDQGGVDAGRNTNEDLDESEPINTVRQPCSNPGENDKGCEFPDWVFKVQVPVPANHVGNTFSVTATDQFNIFTAIESPAGSGTYGSFTDITSISDSGGSDSDDAEICPLDYGDLPNTYPQARANVLGGTTAGKPNATGAVWAGSIVDTEVSQNFSLDATGDDNNVTDDEDGVGNLPSEVFRGNTYELTVTLNSNQNGTNMYYGLWFDWNGDGDFTDTGVDQFYTNETALEYDDENGVVDALVSFTVPNGAVPNYAVRLIVSNMPFISSDFGGTFANGEVEDYIKPIDLPIELLDFTATPVDNKKVLLKWSTATETNNAYFSMQRSKDGLRWEEIAQIKGAGNSSSTLNYFLWDNAPLEGINYYRFQQFDFDGAFSYSPVRTAVITGKGSFSAVLYPNPGFDLFYLQLSNTRQQVHRIAILNHMGQRMETIIPEINATDELYTINAQAYPSGYYWVLVMDERGAIIEKLPMVKK